MNGAGVGVRGQNRSTAVMARRVEPPDSFDFFPTPPWATRALWTHVLPEIEGSIIMEPACGEGDMARTLAEVAGCLYASDIHDYGHDYEVRDFLGSGSGDFAQWIVTNPPFKLSGEFAARSLTVATRGVALLVRSAFTEGIKRYALFERHPPRYFASFAERVPIVKGRLDPKASSATAYCWMVWEHGYSGPSQWLRIPPCRKALERPGDYPAAPAPLLEEIE